MKKAMKIKTLCESCAEVHRAAPYPVRNATTQVKETCEVCRSKAGLKLWIV